MEKQRPWIHKRQGRRGRRRFFWVPDSVWEAVRIRAMHEGFSVGDMAVRALEAHIEEELTPELTRKLD